MSHKANIKYWNRERRQCMSYVLECTVTASPAKIGQTNNYTQKNPENMHITSQGEAKSQTNHEQHFEGKNLVAI
jgi:hypothetical protein